MSIWMFALNGDELLKHAEKVASEKWFIDQQETTQFAIIWKRTQLNNIQSDFQNIQMMNWNHSNSQNSLHREGNEIGWVEMFLCYFRSRCITFCYYCFPTTLVLLICYVVEVLRHLLIILQFSPVVNQTRGKKKFIIFGSQHATFIVPSALRCCMA